MSKTFKTIWNIITSVMLAAIVLLAIFLAGVRLVGLTPYTILSGSMEPTYRVGSLIYVRSIKPENVEAGDAITFLLDGGPVIATHRVVEVDHENRCYRTKGDANNAEDGLPVDFNNLIGKPLFTIPYLGFLSNWILHPPGLYIAISAAVVFIILIFMPDALHKAEKADKRKEEKKA